MISHRKLLCQPRMPAFLQIILVLVGRRCSVSDSFRYPLLAFFHSKDTSSRSRSLRVTSTNVFDEKLQYNVDRYAKILLDEQEQREIQTDQNDPLLAWLNRDYNASQVQLLQKEVFERLSTQQQLDTLKSFLEWLRQGFPYYRDECQHCQSGDCEYLGNQDPNNAEKQLSRFVDVVEIYHCPLCNQTTRFPRYLSAIEVVRRKQGRCSEYSLLLYRILRALNHPARWIVDWTNHVWAEVWMMDRWLSLDPCEAAVDQPLLYQEWGKNQTYIIAFEAPHHCDTKDVGFHVSDVTQSYTTDTLETISSRRQLDNCTQEDFEAAILRANAHLNKLFEE